VEREGSEGLKYVTWQEMDNPCDANTHQHVSAMFDDGIPELSTSIAHAAAGTIDLDDGHHA
jgi:hypothetical protein